MPVSPVLAGAIQAIGLGGTWGTGTGFLITRLPEAVAPSGSRLKLAVRLPGVNDCTFTAPQEPSAVSSHRHIRGNEELLTLSVFRRLFDEVHLRSELHITTKAKLR